MTVSSMENKEMFLTTSHIMTITMLVALEGKIFVVQDSLLYCFSLHSTNLSTTE